MSKVELVKFKKTTIKINDAKGYAINIKSKYKPVCGYCEKCKTHVILTNEKKCYACGNQIKKRWTGKTPHKRLEKICNLHREFINSYTPTGQREIDDKFCLSFKYGLYVYFIPIRLLQAFGNLEHTDDEDPYLLFFEGLKKDVPRTIPL